MSARCCAMRAGLITNPVEVLDRGIVLPAFVVGGVALRRRRPRGYWLAPTMLGRRLRGDGRA